MTDRRATRQRKQEEKMGTGGFRTNNALVLAVLIAGWSAAPAWAQYNSGSSGVHGAFPPGATPAGARYLLWDLKTGLLRYCSTYDTATRPDTCTAEISTAQIPGIPAAGLTTGVFEFSNVDVQPASDVGVLDIYPVGYDGPAPLTILSQGSVRFRYSALHLEGHQGASTQSGLPPTGYGAPGGRPGPGGFAGGNGGKMGNPSTNGNPGFGPTGGAGGFANYSGGSIYGSSATPTPISTSLIPLVGGSGGGGAGAYDTACGFRGAGGGGGGGGGAVLVAANVQIALEGYGIDARGGSGGYSCAGYGGNGSGGSVRLAAPTIAGSGYIYVGNGIVRLEGNASTYNGYVDTIRGTVLATPQPARPSEFPTLRITSVGGMVVGQNPSGAVSTPDVVFQTAPSGPVTVELSASSIPVGTVVALRANPLIGRSTTADSSALAGTSQSSTATASLEIPAGAGVITAVTTFPVTTALLHLLPAIPGLTPKTVEVAADASGRSRLFIIGADARRVEVAMGSDGLFAVVP
jgi:hypothetical protein